MEDNSPFFIATLGCKVNQYESHALREAWLGRGLCEAEEPSRAGVILVNSCAVTERAVADVRALVRRLHRAAPEAAIIISGCAVEVLEKELAGLPGVRAVVPQPEKAGLMALTARKSGLLADISLPTTMDGADTAFPPFALSGYDRSRAVLKIQDGCSHGCAYCIVPLARGPAKSRACEEAVAEAGRLLRAGFREIVISGVNLRQFRLDGKGGEAPYRTERAGEDDFWDFLSHLDAALAPEWQGRARLRISSLEPGQLGEKALAAIKACAMIAPHLHLSLQSGSSSVLSRMGRGHYDPALLPEFFSTLQRIWPVFGLGADILTGFPGESEAEFSQGLELCEALPLTYAHVFPYSRRPGTRAATMPDQIAPGLKKSRAALLRALAGEKKERFLHFLLGVPRLQVVLDERSGRDESNGQGKGKEQGGPLRGVSEFYADCVLAGPCAGYSAREIVSVRPLAVQKGSLVVEAVDSERA